jgi:exo-1,4-beta-D-glucosaminidase
MKKIQVGVWILSVLLVALGSGPAWPRERLELREGWKIQSSAAVQEKAETISFAGFHPAGWYPTSVPATVLAALVENKVYPDPYYGLNLKAIPGYVDGRWLVMPTDSPFYPPWWFRTEFTLPAEFQGQNLVLHLDGISYQADIWLNGKKIAGSDQVVGMFRRFEFPINDHVRGDGPNCLAVELTAAGHLPDKNYHTKQVEATTGWDDHNPYPPDMNLGLWQPVYITASGPVRIQHPYVASDLDLPSLEVAHLTVSAYVANVSQEPVEGELAGAIEDITFSQPVKLAPGEEKLVTFKPEQFPQLNVKNPRLWWPNPAGPQELYELAIRFTVNGKVSDDDQVRFGIREVNTYLNDEGWRTYEVNGRKILIRGGAWMTSDMLLRLTPRRYEALIRYAKEANLNMLRSEGFSIRETEDFYSLADEYGVMVTQQIFGRSIPDEELAKACVDDMMLRIRNHPSLVHFLGHDETFPTPSLDQAYRDMIAKYDLRRTYQPHSGAFNVDHRLKTGGTRTGTLELWQYAGPAHYYTHQTDGAWGFAQSGGIGGVVASLESIQRMIPPDQLWPLWSEAMSFHTVIQGGHYYDGLVKALNERYGQPAGIEDFVLAGHVMNYESARGMFEAYARNKYSATGITTWKYDAAWPAAMTWAYVDWYLLPTGAYYGAKKACEPLHVQYSYDDNSIYVLNSFYRDFKGLKVTARLYNLDLARKYEQSVTVDVGPDGKTEAFKLDKPKDLSQTHFLSLTLEDSAGKRITDNLYWLSTTPDRPGKKLYGMVTVSPTSRPDFSELRRLPKVKLDATCSFEKQGQELVGRVQVKNPTSSLAFFIQLAVTKGPGGMEVAPSYWSENDFSLLPGAEKELEVKFAESDLEKTAPVLRIGGWNLQPSECRP